MTGYDLEQTNRQVDIHDCTPPTVPPNEAVYSAKLTIIFPDGSRHLLRLKAGGEDFFADGYYNVAADGNWAVNRLVNGCDAQASLPGPLVYYTTDGTFVRLVVNHDSKSDLSWTLYFRNGDYVLGGDDPVTFQGRPQQICDRNNNCVSLMNSILQASPYAYYSSLTDDYGRGIQISYGGGGLHTGPDTITIPGYNGAPIQWTVQWTYESGGLPQYWCTGAGGNTQGSTCTAGTEGWMVSEIDPPPQLGLNPYKFSYSAVWGELSSITFPSGTVANYKYWLDASGAPGCPNAPSTTNWYDVLANYPCRKEVFLDGVVTHPADEASTLVINQINLTNGVVGYSSSAFTGPDGGVTTTTFNPYTYNAGALPGDWTAGLVTEIDQPDGIQVNKNWAQNPPPGTMAPRTDISTSPLCDQQFPYDSMNPFVTTETRSIAGNTATTTYTIDQNGNSRVTTEGDWSAGNPLIRKTTLSYYNQTSDVTPGPPYLTTDNGNVYWDSTAPSLLSLPSSKEIDGLSSLTSYEQYCYDNSATPIIGNLTTRARLVSGSKGTLVTCSGSNPSVSSNAIATRYAYGPNGILTVSTDARGVSTQFTYDSQNLYVVEKDEACNPSGTPNSTCTLAEARKTGYTTDFYSGKVQTVTDIDNGASTVTAYVTSSDPNNPFGRPFTVTDAMGKVTSYAYRDAPFIVNSVTYGGGYRVTTPPAPLPPSATCYDQLGRVVLTQVFEGTPAPCDVTQGIVTQYQYAYASPGRYEWVSNPNRTPADATVAGWTRRAYDGAGRLKEEASFSGSANPLQSNSNLTGKVTYDYSANPSYTIMDQAANSPTTANPGSVRTILMDAAGRISSVTETVAGTAQTTSYAYDGMNNLTDVYQGGSGGQHRIFVYDSLGRLTSATNPESGVTNYAYDNNGNVIGKTSLIGPATPTQSVTTCFGPLASNQPGAQCNAITGYSSGSTYGYDGLNRVIGKQYNDGGATPAVTYTYCQGNCQTPYAKGRLTTVSVAGGTTTQYTAFDPMGRILGHSQQHPQMNNGNAYPFSYTYNDAGLLTSVTYPSGRTITTSYDTAGRVGAVSGTLNGATTNYAGPPTGQAYIQYAPQGALSQMNLGKLSNGQWAINEQWGYNSRLQPISMSAVTTASNPLLALTLGYGGTENNGNLLSQTIAGAGLSASVNQWYSYDGANRITNSCEAPSSCTGTGVAWNRGFAYDTYGNGWVSSANPGPTSFTPQANVYDANNHSVVNNAVWDAGGRETNIGGYQYTYDAENRMVSATLNVTTEYVYDGDGRRVAKIDCPTPSPCTAATSGARATFYVYDASGALAAEYASNAPAAPCTTCYLLVDHLGSTRMMTDQNGSPVQCHDYLPFGEELESGQGGRSGCYPAGLGEPGLLFTGKQRDDSGESGLDYFEARYMSSAQGRFTSPDPLTWQIWQYGSDDEKAKFQEFISDPQNFNLYAYVRNNPLKYTDPTGTYYCNGSDADCKKVEAAYNQAVAAAANKNLSKDERTAINQVLTFLGKPGERNGVSVVFAPTAKGSAADTDTTKQFGQTFTMITFNPQKIAGMDANALSETFIHEGTHGLNDFPLGHNPSTQAQEMGTEMNAYTNQSYVAEGLGVASRWGVWSPGITDANRQKAIKDSAQKSTRIWCQNGGVCK
jgi:RHS repeat-associated protein